MSGQELSRVGTYGVSSITDRQRYAQALADAGDLVPRSFWSKPTPTPGGGMTPPRPNPGAILYMLETAAMLGVNPMVGLTNIHIIEGKPSLSANLQAALVREAGHRLRVRVEGEGDNTVATAQIIRSDDPEFTFEVRWGKREAEAAKVMGKDNWKKYLRAMLKARAITECIREACPEVLMGATYSPDELGAVTDSEGEPIDLHPVPSGVAEPKQQAPIPTEEPAEPEAEIDWGKAIADLSSREEALELYAEARKRNLLGEEIKVGRKKVALGDAIKEVGKALTDAESESEGEVPDDGGAAALADDDVVDAELVDDENAQSA